jgi:hypothetical protein
MNPSVEQIALWLLSILLALFVGGFLKSYMSKKGENLATHEDIENLVEQTKKLTAATEEIKASISTDAWQRELKKETSFEVMKAVGRLTLSLTNMEIRMRDSALPPTEEADLSMKFHSASWDLETVSMHARIVCGEQVGNAIEKDVMDAVRQLTNDIMYKRLDRLHDDFQEYQKVVRKLAVLMRVDLGISKG